MLEFIQKLDHSTNSEDSGWLLKYLVEAVDLETGSKLTIEELVDNTIVFLVAGEGTTAVTIIYALWECAQRPEIQSRLAAEVRQAFPDVKTAPTYAIASNLVRCPSLLLIIEFRLTNDYILLAIPPSGD